MRPKYTPEFIQSKISISCNNIFKFLNIHHMVTTQLLYLLTYKLLKKFSSVDSNLQYAEMRPGMLNVHLAGLLHYVRFSSVQICCLPTTPKTHFFLFPGRGKIGKICKMSGEKLFCFHRNFVQDFAMKCGEIM